ncbi:tRNA (guanosine(37)-N1)-methyltransferase TrmD [Patescibacteria group bacterium]|nr:tRNA (guanosine(37)-N1)-methyltransferase TrmD [Patescibacteria group bacterium]
MKISVVTLFPKMVSGFFEESIIKRAVEKKLVELEIINLRDFAIDEYGTVDDRPYGGGAGMVIRVDVVHKAISNLKSKISNPKLKTKILLTSPRGKLFDQGKAREYSKIGHLIIIAGHYEAVDERVNAYIDEEISIGDFVLTGGEIPASAIVDAVVRLIPGVLKKEEATTSESFDIGGRKLLEYPHYTRPEEFNGLKVPPVLLGGNHKEIEKWRLDRAVELTEKKRPELIDRKK